MIRRRGLSRRRRGKGRSSGSRSRRWGRNYSGCRCRSRSRRTGRSAVVEQGSRWSLELSRRHLVSIAPVLFVPANSELGVFIVRAVWRDCFKEASGNLKLAGNQTPVTSRLSGLSESCRSHPFIKAIPVPVRLCRRGRRCCSNRRGTRGRRRNRRWRRDGL